MLRTWTVRRFGMIAGLIFISLQTARGAEAPSTKPSDAMLGETARLIDKPGEIVTVLSNGLTVIAREHRTAPVVTVRMYVKTGSLYEGDRLGSGVSHLFEHLLHSGTTKTRSEQQSKQILEELGGNSNAATSQWYTTYYVNTAARNLARTVDLLADWITNPTFPDDEFKREWGVVQRELERDIGDPQRQLWNLTMETLYDRHPARFPIIGYQPILQRLTKAQIVEYWRQRYVPDNVVVSIAGDADAAEMVRVVRRTFAGFARRECPEIILPEQPPLVTPRTVIKRMKMSRGTALMQMCWPSISLTHPDLYALDVLSYIVSNGESSRLLRSIVREKQLAFAIESFSWTPHWGKGMFAVTSVTAPNKAAACRQAILDEIRMLRDEPVSAEELAKAKRQKSAEHVFGQQTAEAVAQNMADDFISTGDPHFSDAYVANIQKVTTEQVRQVARKYLDPEVFATVQVEPEAATSQATTAATNQPSPITKVVLDNGLRVLLRRDPSVPIVAMQFFLAGGLLAESEADNGIGSMVAELAIRGTPTRTADQIAAFFDSRGGTLAGQGGNNTVYFTSEVLKDDFPEAMGVFADVVLNPTFSTAELDRFRPRVLNAIEQLDDNWRSELQVYFRKRFFSQSPYRFMTIGTKESVERLTSESLKACYTKSLKAGNAVLAVFGDVDPARAEEMVRRHFGALPGGQGPALNLKAEAGIESDTLYVKRSKQPAVAGIWMGYRGTRYTDLSNRFALDVLDCVMSGAYLPGGWLHHELREGTRDLVYEVHGLNFVGLAPGYFGAYAGCQPERVGEVYRIFREQMSKAVAGTITPEEFERAKNILITTEQLQNRTVAQMATKVALDELYGVGFAEYLKYADRINAVTMDDVKRVAKEYLTRAIVTVVTPQPDKVDIGLKPSATD